MKGCVVAVCKGWLLFSKEKLQICDILFLDSVGVCLGGGGKSREGHEIFLSEEKSDRNVKTTGTRISSFLVCIQKRAQYHLPKDQGGMEA